MSNYDVIVVGAGPAGALFAYLTANAGLRVLLLEKKERPKSSDSQVCLNPDCRQIWERLELIEEFENLPHISPQNISISFGHKAPVYIPVPKESPPIYCLEKETLCAWLREKAQTAGAEFLSNIQCQELRTHRLLITDQGEFSCKTLIGADGRNSWVARMADFPLDKKNTSKTAWVTSTHSFGDANTTQFKFFKQGYIGLMPSTGTFTSTYLMLKKNCNTTPQKFINDFLPGNEHPVWQNLNFAAGTPSVVAKNNVLLLGDAARVVEPFTHQGIYLALRSAEIAAQQVIKAYFMDGWQKLDKLYIAWHKSLYQNVAFRNQITDFYMRHPIWGKFILNFIRRSPRRASRYLPCFSCWEKH